jgi:hypothetical protein
VPLGTVVARPIIAPSPANTSSGGMHQIKSEKGVVGRAGAWCVGGAIAGSAAGPETIGTSILLGCVGGASASLVNDLITWLDDDGPVIDPPPPIDLPEDPGPIDPVTVTAPDDPPPPPGGTFGSGSNSPTDSGDVGGVSVESNGGDGGDGGDSGGLDDKPPVRPN